MKRLACGGVGLDCDYVILGDSNEKVTSKTVKHDLRYENKDEGEHHSY